VRDIDAYLRQRQPDRASELIELSAEPYWGSIAHGARDRA
jgi:hypothetical protein